VYKKDVVMVEEHLDDSIKLRLRDYCLDYIVLPQRPKKEIDIKLPALTSRKQSYYIPPANHPWRRPFQFNKQRIKTNNFN